MKSHVRICAALLVSVVLVFAFAGSALAKDNTGNVFFNGDQYVQEGATTQRDLVWAGKDVEFYKVNVGQDALLAGQSIQFADSEVGGSVRAASQRISMNGVKVGSNVTAAAQQIVYGAGSKAVGTYLAAQDISFGGASKGGSLFAQRVNVTGKIDGDLRVFADEVVFGAGAQVTGTCYVTASSAPKVDPKAQVENLQFSQSELRQNAEQAARDAGGALTTGALIANAVSVVWTLLLAVVLLLAMPRLGERVAGAYRKRTGATIATGVLAFFFLPLAVLILAVLVVTLPAAGLLGLFMLAGPLFAPAVTGIGVGKLAFKNMNRWASGLLGALVVSVLLLLPVVKWIVGALCLMFATGYLLQALWRRDRSGDAGSAGFGDGVGPASGQGAYYRNPDASAYAHTQTVPPEGF